MLKLNLLSSPKKKTQSVAHFLPFKKKVEALRQKTIFITQSIPHHWPFRILRTVYKSRDEETGHLLKWSTNGCNFLFLQKNGSANLLGHLTLIKISDSQMKQLLKIRRWLLHLSLPGHGTLHRDGDTKWTSMASEPNI